MKRIHWLVSFLTSASLGAVAQTLPAERAIDSPAYAVSSRGPHHRVWAQVSYATNRAGRVIEQTNSFTELATGLHYRDPVTDDWLESREEIEILLDGSGAVARKGQHRAFFPANIYRGAIELTTPDGHQLRSRPLGISYFDGEKSVLIAELKDSLGQLLPSRNQVIWTNCFTDFEADLVATYRKSGFECDLIFRARPPAPSEWGLGPNARLQLVTEFFDPPQPVKELSAVDEQDGLRDTTLKFGKAMEMGRGKAFSFGGQAGEPEDGQGGWIPVYKSWERLADAQHPGVMRTCLIEEVPYWRMEPHLKRLAALEKPERAIAAAPGWRHGPSLERLLPASRPVESTAGVIQIAKVPLNVEPGVVLDYTAINTGQADYTFQADETYFISATLNLSGTTTFEGGAVLKYASNASVNLVSGSTFNCQATAYRPFICTAKEDNSVGQTVSTGTLSGYYANPALSLNGGPLPAPVLSNFRIAYAQQAISTLYSSSSFFHGQFVNCANGILVNSAGANFRNLLFANVQTAFNGLMYSSVNGQNVTFSGVTTVASGNPQYSSVTLTNCILANVTSLGTPAASGNYNGFFNSPMFGANTLTNSSAPFQTVGAGAHYLADASPYRNTGTTNIHADLLAALRGKTTYPPLILSNTIVSTDTTLSPQAQRDTDTPDLGYAYDPLDYLVCNYKATNCTLTISGGAAIGYYDTTGLWLQDGAQIVCVGTPDKPNRFAHYLAVQEQPVHIGSFTAGTGTPVVPCRFGSVGSPATFRFTHFTRPAPGGSAYDLFGNGGNWCYSSLSVSDCSFANSWFSFSATSGFALTLHNNCFERCLLWLVHYDAGSSTLSLRNNLFRYQSFYLDNFGTTAWVVKDNAFYSCGIEDWGETPPDHGHNAYINTGDRLYPTNSGDKVLSSFVFLSGPLGRFYQPTSSVLINAGSLTNAALVGLFHHTTTTNQMKETNSVVDIGFHYMAVGANGLAVDSDADGLADYFEDKNGDGARQPTESDFTVTDTDGDGLSDFQEFQLGTNPTSTDTDGDGLTEFEEINLLVDVSIPSLGYLDPLRRFTGNTVTPDGEKDSDHDGITNLGELRNYLSDPSDAHTFTALKNDAEYLLTASAGASASQSLALLSAPSFPGGGFAQFTITGAFPGALYDLYFIPDLGYQRWQWRRVYSGIQCDDAGQAMFKLPNPNPSQGYFVILSAEDFDADGLTDGYECWFHYDNLFTMVDFNESDGDLMLDGWEVEYGLNPRDSTDANGGTGNPDNDSYFDGFEWVPLINKVEHDFYFYGFPSYDPLKVYNTAANRPVVTIANATANPYCAVASFTITRYVGEGGSIADPLTVYYALGGDLVYGTDYDVGPTPTDMPRICSAVILGGDQSVTVTTTLVGNAVPSGVKRIVATVTPYSVSPVTQLSDPLAWQYAVD